MALYMGKVKIAGSLGGSGAGSKHIQLTQAEYNTLSSLGRLSTDCIYMTPTSDSEEPQYQYELSAARSDALGGIKIGFTKDKENGKYPVELDSVNKAYVQVESSDLSGSMIQTISSDIKTIAADSLST